MASTQTLTPLAVLSVPFVSFVAEQLVLWTTELHPRARCWIRDTRAAREFPEIFQFFGSLSSEPTDF